jgi:RNA polymerase sigma-70 factor (ECF subfamily)
LEVAVDGVDPTKNDFTDEMQLALSQLPPELRESLLLVVVGELTHQETANALGVPLGTVLSRVCRARQRLRKHMLALHHT